MSPGGEAGDTRNMNGHHTAADRDLVDNRTDDNCNTVNGNVHVKIVSASINNMDVLSGGESDAGDTLSRRNNNSISSHIVGGSDTAKRRCGDVTYYVAKELLMTERTYKRDLELITVSWGGAVGAVAGGSGGGAALARGCLALEPLALPAGALLARLDRALAAAHLPHTATTADTEEPEYKKIAELLYDYLSSTYDAYMTYIEMGGAHVATSERARRAGGQPARAATQFDAASPLPLACLLLRPLHRVLHYHRMASELALCGGGAGAGAGAAALQLAERLAAAARRHLPHAENHALLCQLQRDIAGYDKLLVADREFVRFGCVYKHSSKGLQQRMLFLFSDLLVVCSKSAGGQFRAHAAIAVRHLCAEPADPTNSILVTGEECRFVISMSSAAECGGWLRALRAAAAAAAAAAHGAPHLDTELTHDHSPSEEAPPPGAGGGGGGGGGGSALAHVCWHRAASLSRRRLQLAMRTQLSGYLLRKFKNSHGWQKLWVVFAMFTLFFYKSWQDETALASLPLLGYTVSAPSANDGISKDFVFKLQLKNHVYFFRADSQFTYNRWTEVLQTSAPSHQSDDEE